MSIPLFKIESNRELCPYLALTKYLELPNINFPMKLTPDSPFFLTEKGDALCRPYFMLHIRHILASLGYDSKLYLDTASGLEQLHQLLPVA